MYGSVHPLLRIYCNPRDAMMRPTALVLLLCFLLNGCFSYVPAQSTPGRAARVRVMLAAPTDFRLLDYTANEVVLAEGEMVRADEREVVLSVLQLQARSGYEFAGRGETLSIPRSNIASLQTKRVSLLRSALVAGAVVLIVTLTERLIAGASDSGGGGGGGTPIPT
ncbi:MAG TPA: hypothetical protein VHG28_02665 [Longimicrobiaceae bacterium]|nr:hypothetical protein [Longimicrobiaceae bacterium]